MADPRKLASGETDWSYVIGEYLFEWSDVHSVGQLTFEECIELASVAIGQLREAGLIRLPGHDA